MTGPATEAERLNALAELGVLDTPPEAEFDLITRLAAGLFKVPVALLTLVDRERQWFKSHHGTDVCETDRGIAFCSHTIEGEQVFEVLDLSVDPRFEANPLVVEPPHVRYYAGAPLKLKSGYKVGTFCLIDMEPREALTAEQRSLLEEFARLAVIQLELRQLRRLAAISGTVAAATPDAIICADSDGLITHWNPGAERLFGHSAAEANGAPLEIIIPPHLQGAHSRGMSRLLATGEPKLVGKMVEVPAVHRDGRTLDVELSLASWTMDGGRTGFAAIVRDISARKALERERAEAQRFLDTIVENLPAMLFVKDARTREYLLWNQAGEEATGLGRSDVIGRTDGDLFPVAGEQYMVRDEVTLRTGVAQSFESRFERADGTERSFRTRRVAIPDEAGEPKYLLGISEDVTQWRAAQDRLAFLAGHDPLTHLDNRLSLAERLQGSLDRREELAVLAIDLDRFKAVNDGHGHHAGDLLLIAVARLLREAVDGEGLAARIAGDEFVVLLIGPGAEARAARTTQALLDALSQPIDIGDIHVRIGASIGIAVAASGTPGLGAEDVLRSADLALLRAKRAGRGRFRFFNPKMDEAARRRQRIEALLREAIANDEITLHYQPLACVRTGKIVAFEALARWSDKLLGEIRPDIFIPIAEDSGLIVELGRKVLRMAAAEAALWQPELRISVNLSPIQVQNAGFYDEVVGVLDEVGLAPDRLELEVTEGVMLSETDPALDTLRRLKALGISIAMDDFGTGYSSLSYFRMFPFDKVKIDQSFVRDMGDSKEALAIVQAVIGLARGLGLPVVAEGVENKDQFNMLLAEGCTQVQGYLLGRPAPIEAFEGAVIDRRRGAERAPAARRETRRGRSRVEA